MSMVIRMRFDGKVFIPEEPVDLPVNEPLEFEFKPPEPEWDPEKARAAIRRIASRAKPGVSRLRPSVGKTCTRTAAGEIPTADFARYPGITAVAPSEAVSLAQPPPTRDS